MKIAFLALHFSEYAVRLGEQLRKEANVLLMCETVNAREELGPDFISKVGGAGNSLAFITRNSSFFGVVRNSNELVRNVLKFCPDVIHFQEASVNFVPLSILRLKSFPLTITIHDPLPHSGAGGRSLNSLRHDFNRRLLRRLADSAITHGEALVKNVERQYPWLRGRSYSVPHGPLGGPPLDISPAIGTFLFFGRIQAYKGLGYFVAAIRKLHDQGLPVRGVIAGRGEDLARHRALIDGHPAFELHERYIAHDELPDLFGRAQAVVLPYVDGTQSGVAAMALGFGRAIIATRVGALQDMVRDGDNGLLVPAGDADALAAAMARLMAAPDEAARMGKRSVELGQADLSWQRNAEITLQAYDAALRRKRGLC
jgi:glycosyltransferase involved in cell wall biosynthesis